MENLKSLVDEILEEFDNKFVGITQGTKRVWWVDEPDRIKKFLEQSIQYVAKSTAEAISVEKKGIKFFNVSPHDISVANGVLNQAISQLEEKKVNWFKE